MTRFRLLRPIAARAISGVAAATGDVSASTVTDPPSWAAPAVQPGWVYQSSYAVGVAMTADFGAALNNPDPSGYSYQVLRNGDTVVQSGSNVSGFTYTPVSADQYQQLSFTLTASNGAG
ncbi:MAG: hypothetical protein KA422_13810, partial [Rhizobacter sp.]|nr:hypothetical protein [Rhizobacter sp.]